MRKSNSFFLLMIYFFLLSLTAYGESPHKDVKETCKVFENPLPWSYCDYQHSETTSDDVIYFFHGHLGSEKSWSLKKGIGELLYRYWEQNGQKTPRVVTLSLGPLWLLVKKNKSPYSGMYEIVTGNIFPTIEKQLRLQKSEKMLIGMSMGGFNAAQLLLNRPSHFRKVALLCPAITSLSPFSSAEEIKAYIRKTGADNEMVEKAIMLSKEFIASPEDWSKSSPIEVANAGIPNRLSEVYVTANYEDEYGFFGDTEQFAKTISDQGGNAIFRPISGGHCSFDVTSLGQFLKF